MTTSNSLSEDVLLHVKSKLTKMGGIGLEAVNTFFQPPLVPAINAKPPKIVIHIKDMSGDDEQHNPRRVLLILRDKRKKGQATKMLVKVTKLQQTFTKIFARVKEFHSLRIYAADEVGEMFHLTSAEEASKEEEQKRWAFDTMLCHLSTGLIGAISSFPQQQSVTIRRVFFPPNASAMTTQLVSDSPKNLAMEILMLCFIPCKLERHY